MEVKILLYHSFGIFFFGGKCAWTYASSFSFEHFLVSVQLYSLSPAYQLPGICLLMVEMCGRLVSWLAGWLTLQFHSYGAFLHVLKNYHRLARKKSYFPCCKTAHATLNSKCNLKWGIFIYFTYQYRQNYGSNNNFLSSCSIT